ncbi:hypothetical protein KIMC2_00030 [Xylocopilactobacillus apis]|uniref:Uncharacterized protein n=2 Tax=Xylocopilactobacillus apis TaxID=2932183 RepID=A0AAU9DB86_9LACO|nr:hypothetical protein KIMC2_00030 [Xylocopilactobacillus apis]
MDPILTIILVIPLTYFALWVVYYFSMYLLRLIKRKPVDKKTELLNLILIITLIEFALMFSEFAINWNYQLLTIVSDLVTALSYFFFASNIEQTSQKTAAIYALSITVLQTLLMIV